MILLQLIQIYVAAGVVPPSPQGAGNLDMLRRAAAAEGTEYLHVREEVLKHTETPWNIAEAAAKSWELGVAAFVFNARWRSPETFQQMDAVKPRHYADGTSYRLPGHSVEEHVTFLLEKAWKPIGQRDRQRGLNDLRRNQGSRMAGVGDPAMWRAIWEECPIEELRATSLFFLASSSNPDVLDIVAEVLSKHKDDRGLKRLQARCLAGLWYNALPEAAELVLAEWEYLKQQPSLAGRASGALASSPSPRAREAVYGVALDKDNPDEMRYEAVVRCSLRQHPGDRKFVEKFLGEVESLELKRKVVMGLGKLPLEDIRSAVREILGTSTDPQLTSAAALALSEAYYKVDPIDDRLLSEDIRLLEEVAGRPNVSDSTRFTIINQIVPNMKERNEHLKREAQNQ